MKKIFILALTFLITCSMQSAIAKNIKVEALSSFTTANPPKNWQVKVLEGFVADNGITIHQNTIIEGRIENVKSPKRLKRNATFRFVPTTYYDPQIGETKLIKREFSGKYSSRNGLDAKTVAKKGAITAGNMLIGSFVAPSVALVEGAIKNERDNRAKSAVVSAYESTPLSYANKGKEIEIAKGQKFIMSFTLKEDEISEASEPNYSYEMAK